MGLPNIIQNHINDIQTIKSTYLPLNGGTINGNITLSTTSTKMWNFSNDKYKGFEIAVGGQHESTGASLNLYHKDSPTSPGCFFLCAADGTNKSILWASASGLLTWNGNNVVSVESSGSNYIRYSNGLQICWARLTHPETTTTSYLGSDSSDRTFYSNVVWTFPVAFLTAPCVSSMAEDVLIGLHTTASGGSSTTKCTIVHTSAVAGVSYTQNIAIGLWK